MLQKSFEIYISTLNLIELVQDGCDVIQSGNSHLRLHVQSINLKRDSQSLLVCVKNQGQTVKIYFYSWLLSSQLDILTSERPYQL